MFKLLTKTAKLPEYAHKSDACADLFSSIQQHIPANSTMRLHTGLICEIPDGFELQIRPKSGLAMSGLIAIFGTIDSGYTGEILVMMQNTRNGAMLFYPGNKIAQISLQPVLKIPGVNYSEENLRNSNGFGSTGK